MKRRFTILTAAFALLAFLAIPMGMMGQTASFAPADFSGQGTSGTGSEISATVDGVTFACDKGFGTTQIRCYSGGIITISSSNTITAISFTFSGSYNGGMETSYTSLSTTSWTKTLSSQARITACSVSYTGGDTPQPTTYTVTFDAGDGTFVGNTDFPNASNTVAAGTYTLPSATPTEGYVFNGWALGENTYEGGASYTVSGNADFVASYTENTTPTPGGTTATLNIQAYAEANSWTNGTQYTTATVAPVTFTANGGGNTGKYYESGHDWRFYQGESASITITVPEGYTLVSVTPTYSVSNGGVLKNGNATIASGTTVNVSGTSVTFTVGNSGSATNGQVRFTNIDVVYVSDGGTQTASDLAITNESTTLTFDLYNNTTAQVISYTTSSTGAITITPAESDYFSYVHDATAKTITVTPTAVTPSAQTVTISQEADDDYYAGTATFTVSVANSDPNQPGTVNNPYTVAEAIAAIDALGTINEAYVSGIVCQVDSYNSNYSSITYWISDDGTTTTKLQVYSGKGIDGANFESIDDVQVNDIVVVKGNLKKFNSTYEFDYNNELVSLERPQSTEPSVTVTPATIDAPAEGADGTLTITYENIENFYSFDYYFCDANGNELEDTDSDYPGDWIYAEINEENDAYSLSYIIDANDGAARTAYMKVYTFDDNEEEAYAIVTISQAAPVAPVTGDKYVKVTSTADLTSGQYLIVYEEGSVAFDGSLTTLDAASNTISVVTNNNEIGVDNITTAAEFTIDVTNGTLKSASGKYIGVSSNSNGLKQTDNASTYTNSFSIDNNGNAVITAVFEGSNMTMRYNNASNQNRFRYYSNGQQAIQLYKKVGDEPATETYTLDITGYEAGSTGGYYLIASPVTVDPEEVEGMTTDDFDLYYFDEAEDNEWRNYEANAFNLVPGKGYLYAKQATEPDEVFHFELTGTPYNNQPITLSKTVDGDFPGWNLVGNPFGQTAYIDRDFYVMKSDGSEIITGEGNEIAVMQGFFVIADQDGEELEISTTAPTTTGEKVVMNVTSNRGNVIDRAIVRFGEGRQLPKFQLRENSTKISIAKDNNEYAVVRSEAEGEMPVSFKAEKNGTYTFSVNTENVEMEYLHLIDNMTGADVDLLATPSYSFEARTNDYESRFRLVFSGNTNVGSSTSSETFAFFNGNSWVINNEGEATLQVIDMMGRVLSNEQFNGSYNNSLNLSAGVYVLRLSNGNTVKTQKVVVD